ncbi:expressed protein [Phakopsora pachyrhizi]|uniref:Expressed protein n=1 Tax=Phakopsora pachyrhizi TaxID=170000 RepID=A0AAV0BP91_PHAPC|nr:expressed protein [Phakopsora pachyrhizi]
MLFTTQSTIISLAFVCASLTSAASTPRGLDTIHRRATSIDINSLGSCSDPSIEFGAGFGGRRADENSFRPANLNEFNHGEALNIGVITDSICNTLVNKCGLKNEDAAFTNCKALKTEVGNGKDGALADKWNAGFGITTNFASNA